MISFNLLLPEVRTEAGYADNDNNRLSEDLVKKRLRVVFSRICREAVINNNLAIFDGVVWDEYGGCWKNDGSDAAGHNVSSGVSEPMADSGDVLLKEEAFEWLKYLVIEDLCKIQAVPDNPEYFRGEAMKKYGYIPDFDSYQRYARPGYRWARLGFER